MDITWRDTAVVFTDPQNEVLSEQGGAWRLVRDTVRENRTVENMDRIFHTAKRTGFQIFISPHYHFPGDDEWRCRDPLGSVMHEEHMFARRARSRSMGSRDRSPIGSLGSSPVSRAAGRSW